MVGMVIADFKAAPQPPFVARETVAGLVLAGGASRRMGRDKAAVALAGQMLLHRAVSRLAPQVGPLAVNRAEDDGVPALPDGLPVLRDAVPGREGPLAGLLAGLLWARDLGAPLLVTVAVDTPFFPIDLAGRLAAAVDGRIAVAVSSGRPHPVFAATPTSLADDLAGWLAGQDDRSVARWQAQHGAVAVSFAAPAGDVDPFFNLNTPDDLAAAEAAVRTGT